MTIEELEKAIETADAIMVGMPLDESQVIYIKADKEDFKDVVNWLRTYTRKTTISAELAQPSNVIYVESLIF